MTNGDSLDDFTDLTLMPGVPRVQAADMDGDGDLDVVACAFLPNAEHSAFQLLERQATSPGPGER